MHVHVHAHNPCMCMIHAFQVPLSSSSTGGRASNANGRYEPADSIAGALPMDITDKKMYPGAHAKGWRIFAKDDNGHFWYRIGTYRFSNRTEALHFDRSLDASSLTTSSLTSSAPEAAPDAGAEAAPDAGAEQASDGIDADNRRAVRRRR